LSKLEQLRPTKLSEVIGQESTKRVLSVRIEAAQRNERSLPHVIFHGPAGHGKTTLAKVVAHEMEAELNEAFGSTTKNPSELVSTLTQLKAGSVLFIDEIHALNRKCQETLYSAMEDFQVTWAPTKKSSFKVDLKPFTLIGATTEFGTLSKPLMDRFGMNFEVQAYTNDEIRELIRRNMAKIGLGISGQGIPELIAEASRNNPRLVNHLLLTCADYTLDGTLTADLTTKVLSDLGYSKLGLNQVERRILDVLNRLFSKQPVGLETLATCVRSDERFIQEVCEPNLIQKALLVRTNRGRQITQLGMIYIEAIGV
jgi:Holliday junction DNA helicase RuvB